MATFDDRIVKVGFEINGELRTYDNLWIAASGTKYANPLQDEAEIKIANLAQDVRDYLVTETSPFNKNRTPKRVVIDAGRVSTGTRRIYTGDIITVSVSQPPDITLTIKAKTGQFMKGNLVSLTNGATITLSELSKKVSENIQCNLKFEADDKQIANHSYCGAQIKQIDDLQDVGDIDVYQDGDTLVVKNKNVSLTGDVRVLNKSTGMIGIPEIDEQGIKVKMLYDNVTTLGGAVRIESELNKALNGIYVIYKLSFDISNRETQFYLVAECVKKGYGIPSKKKK